MPCNWILNTLSPLTIKLKIHCRHFSDRERDTESWRERLNLIPCRSIHQISFSIRHLPHLHTHTHTHTHTHSLKWTYCCCCNWNLHVLVSCSFLLCALSDCAVFLFHLLCLYLKHYSDRIHFLNVWVMIINRGRSWFHVLVDWIETI